MHVKMITIDPGDHTGYAIWKRGEKNPIVNQIALTAKELKTLSQEEQLTKLWNRMNNLLRGYFYERVDKVIIEGVEIWGGSLKSITSARRGNLSKLSYLIGGYCGICYRCSFKFEIIPASGWKGQLTKDMVKRRIERAGLITYKSNHMNDAIGIGLAVMGKL